MNYRPYESVPQRLGRRNKGNERAILASGICAFASSFFSNIATTGTMSYKMLYLVPAFIVFYLLQYWLYGKCYEGILNSAVLSKWVLGGLHREDITHVLAEEIPTDLTQLLDEFRASTDGKKLLIAKAHYEIANMLDFISHYSKTIYIFKPKNTKKPRSSAMFVSMVTINAIFEGIKTVLDNCECDDLELSIATAELRERAKRVYRQFT